MSSTTDNGGKAQPQGEYAKAENGRNQQSNQEAKNKPQGNPVKS